MHPLINDLSVLSLDELHTKYADLTKRMSQAYRMNYTDAVYQLQLFMGDYQAEIQRRNEKIMEELASKGAQFKNIIDIQ